MVESTNWSLRAEVIGEDYKITKPKLLERAEEARKRLFGEIMRQKNEVDVIKVLQKRWRWPLRENPGLAAALIGMLMTVQAD